MKLINKKTNEMAYFGDGIVDLNKLGCKNVAEMIEAGWEDYKEPKGTYFINTQGDVQFWDSSCSEYPDDWTKEKEIGNYFETEEEAKKAVEKLKAAKRLKDTYFIKFDLDFVKNTINFTYRIDGTLHSALNEERIVFEDMKTLFGSEE